MANRSPVQAFKNRTRVCPAHACACPPPHLGRPPEGTPGTHLERGGRHFSQAWRPRALSRAAKKEGVHPGLVRGLLRPSRARVCLRPRHPRHTHASPEEDVCVETGRRPESTDGGDSPLRNRWSGRRFLLQSPPGLPLVAQTRVITHPFPVGVARPPHPHPHSPPHPHPVLFFCSEPSTY